MIETDIIKMSTGLELQKFDSEVGELTAYVTTFNNTDKVGDVIAPGALDKFVKEFKQDGGFIPMLWNHKIDEPIGEWTKFEINSRGVKGTGEIFTDVTRGNDTRNLIKRGVVGSVSIGFRATDFEQNSKGGRLFKEIELKEVSVVLSPANPKARITSAKNEDGSINERELETALRDVGLTQKERKLIISATKQELRDVLRQESAKEQLLAKLKL